MGVHNITSKAEWDAAMGEKGVAVVDFFATWCGPCKVIAPKIVEYVILSSSHYRQANTDYPPRRFSDKYTNARFYKLDVDEVPEVAQEVGVRAMPTFMLYKDGEKVNEVVGANPPAVLSAIEAASA